jgi:hypothetical protein
MQQSSLPPFTCPKKVLQNGTDEYYVKYSNVSTLGKERLRNPATNGGQIDGRRQPICRKCGLIQTNCGSLALQCNTCAYTTDAY